MRKTYALLLSFALFAGCLGLYAWNLHRSEGVSFVMRGAETEKLMQGADGDTEFVRLLNGEILDLNSASAKELQKLPSIGEVLAQAIVDYREEHGAFASVEELLNIEGIGTGRLETIRYHVRIGKSE